MNNKMFGRYIISDSKIYHGKPTFRGTRIMVSQVMEKIANGMAWETTIEEWRGSIKKEAIAETIRLANQAFLEHADEYTMEQETAL